MGRCFGELLSIDRRQLSLAQVQTKAQLRENIWKLLQNRRVARFPGADGRIPNFIGAEACAKLLAETGYWQAAHYLKANPDSPQRALRQRALAEGKVIYMAVPRLRADKPFIELDPKKLKCSPYAASSIKGAGQYGRPITIDEIKRIDLVICGSVAVNRHGARVGKGGGYSDLEFALLSELKKIRRNTPIVTSVHALQIVDAEIPMTDHDIPLNAIVTPDQIIDIQPEFPRPKAIYWPMLRQEQIADIPVLAKRHQNR
ncbi:MAG TPA: 5-formyltetrahydrofolate cyclo-ligase [Candidatus Binatus sp.]|nr:5-formyltetrahydrofolate cyclo-ligase [Candidatus Binatus sp.]